MSVAVPAQRQGPSIADRIGLSIADSLVVARRNTIKIIRVPTVLIFELLQPIMFVLLFRYVFGGAIAGLPPGVDYVNYLMPGIFVQNAIFGSTTTAIGFAEDLKAGIIDRFRSLPMARSAVLAGRTTSDLIKNFVLVALMIGIGYLVGFSFEQGLLQALGMVVLVLAVGFSFSWISATIGLALKDLEAVQAASFTWIFPLVFVSTVFVPLETMPWWLQVVARNNPVSIWANTARALAVGPAAIPPGQSLDDLMFISALWILGILAVFVPLSIRLYRKLT
jgi:ABC transporter DrrB family efflux protein